jgi:uncharacterized membrane protein (Fun14 family)
LYIVNTLPIFAPFQQVARVVITVIGILILIMLLLQLLGGVDVGLPRFRG